MKRLPAASFFAPLFSALFAALIAAALPGCAALPTPRDTLAALPPGSLLLLGEQHDAPAHQQMAQQAVEQLAGDARLAAVVLEMAERGADTRGLPRDADEAAVMARLRWNTAGWPWERYRGVVLAAVRAGVPVLGGNLPRADMGAAMRDASLDTRLPPAALATQREHIRDGHCGLLPETQLPGMTRIQVARDRSMAQTLADAAEPARHVLLLAGGRHVQPDLGAPVHLPPALVARTRAVLMVAGEGAVAPGAAHQVWRSAALPPTDYCAGLRQQVAPKAPATR